MKDLTEEQIGIEQAEIEEPKRNIRVVLVGYPTKTFKAAEYFVSQNRTLVIGAQVTKEQRDEQLKRYGYIQAIATYNKDAWTSVEVLEPKE